MHINKNILFEKLNTFINQQYLHTDKELLLALCEKIIFNDPTQNCIIKGKRNVENGISNIEYGKSNIKNGKSNITNGEFNIENGKSNIENGESNIENSESNIENSEFNVEYGKSNIEYGKFNVGNGEFIINHGKSHMVDINSCINILLLINTPATSICKLKGVRIFIKFTPINYSFQVIHLIFF